MKLCDGIHLAGSGFDGFYLTDRIDCNVYVFETSEGWAMIDAGAGRYPELIIDILQSDGIAPSDVRYLLLTHAHGDHMGGAAYFKQRLGLSVIASEAEAGIALRAIEQEMGLDVAKDVGFYPLEYKAAPVATDRMVSVGESFFLGGVGLTCFDARGHSPGGLCYLLHKNGKTALFTGDLIRHGGLISLQDVPGNNLEGHKDSIAGLVGMGVDIFLPGHGLVSMQGGQKHIELAARELGIA